MMMYRWAYPILRTWRGKKTPTHDQTVLLVSSFRGNEAWARANHFQNDRSLIRVICVRGAQVAACILFQGDGDKYTSVALVD